MAFQPILQMWTDKIVFLYSSCNANWEILHCLDARNVLLCDVWPNKGGTEKLAKYECIQHWCQCGFIKQMLNTIDLAKTSCTFEDYLGNMLIKMNKKVKNNILYF